MTADALREAMYALGDSPELCQVLDGAATWRADREFDDKSEHRQLAGRLCYYRDILKLAFGITITPEDVTVAELEWVAVRNRLLVADALHDAGVDFGRTELVTMVHMGTIPISFFFVACAVTNVGMVKKAITWGAHCEISVVTSAYFMISKHRELSLDSGASGR
jgi:hypothetical protein